MARKSNEGYLCLHSSKVYLKQINMATKKDNTRQRRIEGGPNREQLIIDCLRLGENIPYLDEHVWRGLYKQQAKNVPLVDIGKVYDGGHNDTWRIRYKMPKRQIPFEAFYSTKTRSGYICRAEEIASTLLPNCVIPAYRSLTDYQIMGLLQLAGIARNEPLNKHIMIRIIRAIKGVEYVGGKYVHKNVENVKAFFKITWEGPKNIETVHSLRKLLG